MHTRRTYPILVACWVGVVFPGWILHGSLDVCNAAWFQDGEIDADTKAKTGQRRIRTPLQNVLDAGVNAELSERLVAIEPYQVSLKSEAAFICDAISNLSIEGLDLSSFDSTAISLIGLFERAEDPPSPAHEVFAQQGQQVLVDFYDKILSAADGVESPYLLTQILEVLASYETAVGTDRVIAAANAGVGSKSYGWYSIFSRYTTEHPQRTRLYSAMSKSIPKDEIATALLNVANQQGMNEDSFRHPFDSPKGREQLQRWLEAKGEKEQSTAYDAAVALAYLSKRHLDALLKLAIEHPDVDVQMEGAWAAGMQGRTDELRVLVEYCKDVRYSSRAVGYLSEIGREDLIPREANEEGFRARAEFTQWLAHPNELGEFPERVEIVDQRELIWPMEKESRRFYVLRFHARDPYGLAPDTEDCGVVGSMTWCFFTMKMHCRPPEDVYAIHAYFEMNQQESIKETDLDSDRAEDCAPWLAAWTGETLENPKLLKIAKPSRRLKIPARQVALLSGTLGGEKGWLVIDGERSAWFPSSEQPEDAGSYAPLMIHIGRQLLGLNTAADRSMARPPERAIDPHAWLAKYESLLSTATAADGEQLVQLFVGPISEHYDRYVEFLQQTTGRSKNAMLLETYPKLLSMAQSAPEAQRGELIDIFTLIGRFLSDYADALVEDGRASDVETLVNTVAPYFDHFLGHATLGSVAQRANLWELAERYLLKAREGEDLEQIDEVVRDLARVWIAKGESQRAEELLVECIAGLVRAYAASEDRAEQQRFRKGWEATRELYLESFPQSRSQLDGEWLNLPNEIP
jgi:hypothetical protein